MARTVIRGSRSGRAAVSQCAGGRAKDGRSGRAGARGRHLRADGAAKNTLVVIDAFHRSGNCNIRNGREYSGNGARWQRWFRVARGFTSPGSRIASSHGQSRCRRFSRGPSARGPTPRDGVDVALDERVGRLNNKARRNEEVKAEEEEDGSAKDVDDDADMQFFHRDKILSPGQLKRLSEHRYSCSNASLLDAFLQPWWCWLVSKVPIWLAPNLITILGLSVNIITTLVLVWYSPDAKAEVTNFISLVLSHSL